MSNVQLTWPNKDLKLFASGEFGYEWIEPTDRNWQKTAKMQTIDGRSLDRKPNLLAIGDGLDVLDALSEKTTLLYPVH